MREICIIGGPRQQTPATGFPTCDDADMMHRHRICAGQGVVSIPTIPQRGTWGAAALFGPRKRKWYYHNAFARELR